MIMVTFDYSHIELLLMNSGSTVVHASKLLASLAMEQLVGIVLDGLHSKQEDYRPPF